MQWLGDNWQWLIPLTGMALTAFFSAVDHVYTQDKQKAPKWVRVLTVWLAKITTAGFFPRPKTGGSDVSKK